MKDGVIEQIDTPENMTMSPANDYVREFIDSVDKSHVYTAENIMTTPFCMTRISEGVRVAIKEMEHNKVSSAYIVDDNMIFVGMVFIDGAIKAKEQHMTISDIVKTDCKTVFLDTPMHEIIGLCADYSYPIAVLDKKNRLKGIISRSTILTTISE
jgi:glycine betaine/proline transport system ATP-binding protein